MKDTVQIFVYGTLKNGMCNEHFLKRLVGKQVPLPVSTTIEYPMYKSEQYFPYLENQPGIGHIIEGEMYTIQDKYLNNLDMFEGVPDLYIRGEIEVELESLTFNCLCYFKAENTSVDLEECFPEWLEN